jgi:hypothetical protein
MAFGRSSRDDRARTTTEDGPGLARGPALIIGTILSAFGLILFLKSGDTPTTGFPDADVEGLTFLGFETNGWTAWLTTAAGALLLFGAAQHLLAKVISLIVGLVLGAAAVIGFVDGDVLGLAATNFWTNLGWAIAAGLLLLNVFAPRVERERDRDRRPVNERGTRRDRDRTVVDRDRDGIDDRDERGVGRREGVAADRVSTRTEHRT